MDKDYIRDRAAAAKWIYERKDGPDWWAAGVLTKNNPDPTTLGLPPVRARHIFTDLASRDLLVPSADADGTPRFLLNLAPEGQWREVMDPPGVLGRVGRWFTMNIIALLTAAVTASVTAWVTTSVRLEIETKNAVHSAPQVAPAPPSDSDQIPAGLPKPPAPEGK